MLFTVSTVQTSNCFLNHICEPLNFLAQKCFGFGITVIVTDISDILPLPLFSKKHSEFYHILAVTFTTNAVMGLGWEMF